MVGKVGNASTVGLDSVAERPAGMDHVVGGEADRAHRQREVVAGQAAWVRAEHGEGRIHLFGFRPQYRGWTQGTFQLLFRAMLFDRRRD